VAGRIRRQARAVAAVALKNLRVVRRYPVMFGAMLVVPLYQLVIPSLLLGATFMVGGRALGLASTAGTADLAGFLFLGGFLTSLIYAVFWGVAWGVQQEMETGTLETVWLLGARPAALVMGDALSALVVATLAGAAMLGVGALVFHASYQAAAVYALPVLPALVVSLIGVAFLVTAAVLAFRETSLLIDLASLGLLMASGVMFPITILPAAVQVLVLALPTTLALDILRVYALGSPSLLPLPAEYVLMCAGALLTLAAGHLVFERTVRRTLTRGTIGFH
jgi:ABC-2 type transport system permease protein